MSSAFQNPSLSPPILPPLIHPPTWRQYSLDRCSPSLSSQSTAHDPHNLHHQHHHPYQSPHQHYQHNYQSTTSQQSSLTHLTESESGRVASTWDAGWQTMPSRDRTEGRVLNRSHHHQQQQQHPQQRHTQDSGPSSSSLPLSDDGLRISNRQTTISIPSIRSRRYSNSPTRESKIPLTPVESPEIPNTRKRDASEAAVEDHQRFDSVESATGAPYDKGSGFGARDGAGAVQVCICQPDPKIPRPRNAFILYRQHHQASVVAKNPGLANPEISKIIGEQWRNQPVEVKNEWKALAEEEKLRHQQQYPTYRYQPKRNTGRRNSTSSDTPGVAGGEKARCPKCGGRTVLSATSTVASAASQNHRAGITSSPSSASLPQSTPFSSSTPVSHTIPPLRDLALQSPLIASRRSAGVPPPPPPPPPPPQLPPPTSHLTQGMTQTQQIPSIHHYDDRGPLSPQSKRRRYEVGENHPRSYPSNGISSSSGNTTAQPRYNVAHSHPHGPPHGPGTPYPFVQSPAYPYPQSTSTPTNSTKRENLPGLRGVMSPQAQAPPQPPPTQPSSGMVPPLRPGVGYQQHRIAQGHHPDRSLTLPPLQTAGTNLAKSVSPGILATAGVPKSAEEIIMSMNLNYKIKVLGQISPPAPPRLGTERGVLIAVEGDSPSAALELAKWLKEALAKEDDRVVTLLDGPNVDAGQGKAMTSYHRLVADWVERSEEIMESLIYKRNRIHEQESPVVQRRSADRRDVGDSERSELKRRQSASSTNSTAQEDTRQGSNVASAIGTADNDVTMSDNASYQQSDLQQYSRPPTPPQTASTTTATTTSFAPKPVVIVPNYSYYASNVFACRIPITDAYSPPDHWQWAATQWRGTAPPDLTIFVRDGTGSPATDPANPVGANSALYHSGSGAGGLVTEEELRLFIVSRKGRGDYAGQSGEAVANEIGGSVLRRLAFEVNERVMVGGNGVTAGMGNLA